MECILTIPAEVCSGACVHCMKYAKTYSIVVKSKPRCRLVPLVALQVTILSSNAQAQHDMKGAQYLVAEGCCRT